jgi:hypothetical protein
VRESRQSQEFAANTVRMTEGPLIEEAPFPLTDVDRWILSQTDEEFKKHDWDELRIIIGEYIGLFGILCKTCSLLRCRDKQSVSSQA